MEDKAKNAIIRARVQLLLEQPFFGVLALYLQPKVAQLPPYTAGMGTDGRYLYFQPDKILKMSEEELEATIAHEVLHLALQHLYRRGNRDFLRWNVATDYAVNAIISQNFNLPEWALYEKDFEGKCAEEIYELLPAPQCPKCGSKHIKGARCKIKKIGGYTAEVELRCEDCGHTWQEKTIVSPNEFPGYPMQFDEVVGDSPSFWDDHSFWENMNENQESVQRMSDEWKRRLIRAAQSAKVCGHVPAGLERFIEDILYPRLSWRQLLRQYTTLRRGMRPCWRRPNKKLLRYGVYYPTKKHRTLEMAVAVDTSGSISDEELKSFLSEIRGILSSFRSFKVRLFACDADIHTDMVATSLEDLDEFKVKLKGYGGTSFVPVFKALEGNRVQVLVYLTDGHGTYPQEPPGYDVIWVISEQGDPSRPPFGKVIHLKNKND